MFASYKTVEGFVVQAVGEKYLPYVHGPIGRRALAAQMDLSESGIRNDIRTLKETGMLEMSLLGVTVTPAGREVIAKLRRYVNAMHEIC